MEKYIPTTEAVRVIGRSLRNDPTTAVMVAEEVKKIKTPIYRCFQCRWGERGTKDASPESDTRYCSLLQKTMESNFFCGYGCPKPRKEKPSG